MPVIYIPFGFTSLLSRVGNDKVTKSSVYGLWDPRYFDGGHDMIARLQYDLFSFHSDDTPFFSDENSGSSSPQVGENDADGVTVRYMDKLNARKVLKLKARCKKKNQNQDRGTKASLGVKAGSRLAIFEPA